jgi:hypothetical protein
MIRVTSAAFLLLGMFSTAQAQLPVAPPPREVRDDGSRDPAPPPEVVKQENPLEIVERIIKNSKEVGDKLAMTDTSSDTRKTQEKILKDIDALLNQNPPPDQNKDKDKDKDKDKEKNKDPNDKNDKNDKKDMMPMGKDDMMPMGKNDMPPPKGMGMDEPPMGKNGMDEQPMGGDQPKERRPRQGGGNQKKESQPKDPGPMGSSKDKEPMGGAKQPPKDPKGGKTPDPKGGKFQNTPLLPFEDEVVKDVWGHLPDKLRQQASQYYREEAIARYAELLKMYYASLAEKK